MSIESEVAKAKIDRACLLFRQGKITDLKQHLDELEPKLAVCAVLATIFGDTSTERLAESLEASEDFLRKIRGGRAVPKPDWINKHAQAMSQLPNWSQLKGLLIDHVKRAYPRRSALQLPEGEKVDPFQAAAKLITAVVQASFQRKFLQTLAISAPGELRTMPAACFAEKFRHAVEANSLAATPPMANGCSQPVARRELSNLFLKICADGIPSPGREQYVFAELMKKKPSVIGAEFQQAFQQIDGSEFTNVTVSDLDISRTLAGQPSDWARFITRAIPDSALTEPTWKLLFTCQKKLHPSVYESARQELTQAGYIERESDRGALGGHIRAMEASASPR